MDQTPLIQTSQIITLILFLGALGAVWFLVQRNRDGLAKRVHQGKRIAVAEVTAISPTDRAMILSVDNREYLVLRARGFAPVMVELQTGEAK